MKKLLGIVVRGLLWCGTVSSEEISPRDVERYCEVYMYSERYGDVECSRSYLRIVERRCEGYLYSEKYGDIEVDTQKSFEYYKKWNKMAKERETHPRKERRPLWMKRPLSPQKKNWYINEEE